MAPCNRRLAVLIDADNAQAALIEPLLREVARFGMATVRRVYGDWTTPHLKGWKERLNAHALQPIQQFGYTTGKNSTDSSLIIDAMDLLHAGRVDGFCLVSSDSDFTRLATRVRESGLPVYGFGERKTPQAFAAACDEFVYIADPRQPGEGVLRLAVTKAMREDGWSPLSAVGSLIRTNPEFEGVKQLGKLVRTKPFLEVKSVPSGQGAGPAQLYVRLKEAANRA